jgi:hypothetical protein
LRFVSLSRGERPQLFARSLAEFLQRIKQPLPVTRGEFLVSVTPEAIEWNPAFEGVEIAVISGDPNRLSVYYSR